MNQRLAWFAGFLPHDNPRYAFAVLYEGRPGETVSGGRMAAPMVRNFFEPIKDDIKDIIAPPKKALIVVAEEPEAPEINPDGTLVNPPAGDNALRALPVNEPQAAEEVDDSMLDQPVKAIPVDEDAIIDDGENVE